MQTLFSHGRTRWIGGALAMLALWACWVGRPLVQAQTPTLTPAISLPIVMHRAQLPDGTMEPSPTLSATPTLGQPTMTPSVAASATLTPTNTIEVTLTPTNTAEASPTPTVTLTVTSSVPPSETATPEATETPTPSPTATPTITPTATLTPAPLTGCRPDASTVEGLAVLSCNLFVQSGQVVVVGEVQNNRTQQVEDVRVQITFHNSVNQPVGIVTGFLEENLLPAAARSPFRRVISTLPTGYTYPGLVTVAVVGARNTTREPMRQALTIVSQDAYTESESGDYYYVAEVRNTTGTRLESLDALLTTYDAQGRVLNVAVPREVGGASSLDEFLDANETGPFKLRLRAEPLASEQPPAWIFLGVPRPAPTPVIPTLVGQPLVVAADGTVRVTGQLRNNSTNTIEFPSVVVTLYDANGVIRNAMVDNTIEPLAPGQQVGYEVLFADNVTGAPRVEVEAQSS